MKSEERHKLHQNALAQWLTETFETIKPYQNAILAGLIVVILAIIFTVWWRSESASSASRAWTQLFAAFGEPNPSAALEKVAEDNPRSHAAPAADLVAADILLAQGCSMLFINKATATQQLNKALELYQSASEKSPSSTLRAQANFGLAKTWESLGKLDTAIKIYTDVTTEWPDTVYAQMSTRRLDDLKRTSTKEVYDKFARFDPKPTFSQPPAGGGIPGLDKIPEEGPVYSPVTPKEQGAEEKKTEKAENKAESNMPGEKSEKPADQGQSTGGEKSADAQPAAGAGQPAK
jgi:predicted negative regulator of RcsB-dependent stress response